MRFTKPKCLRSIGAISTTSPFDQLDAFVRRKDADLAHAVIGLDGERSPPHSYISGKIHAKLHALAK